MHAFTPNQRSKLLANRNVKEVSEKSITFNPAFKIKAVHKYLEGMAPDKIFEDAGIPITFFKEVYTRSCLKRWVHKFQTQGEDSLKIETRGTGGTGRPRLERPEDLTYEELLSLVEIQREALEEVKKQNALERKKKR